MADSDELQTLVQVALMYYNRNYTQQQIAGILKITRQTVSKLLGEARNRGIVDIKIRNPVKDIEEGAEILKKRFKLKNAVIVPNTFKEIDLIRSVISQRAAAYIIEVIKEGYKNIAVSWGKTIFYTIGQIENTVTEKVNIFPLIGASNKTSSQYMINEMVGNFAKKIGAEPTYAYIPADPVSDNDARLFKQTSSYAGMKKLWDNIDVAVVGLGMGILDGQPVRYNHPGENTKISNEATGEICTHFYNDDGVFLERQGVEILCASVENLKKSKRVIAVAGGIEKIKAIRGALMTGVITDLITDFSTCEAL